MCGATEPLDTALVADFLAQACNLFPVPDLARKLDMLRKQCEEEGRDYDDIEKLEIIGDRIIPVVSDF
jgi:hypothetical protein